MTSRRVPVPELGRVIKYSPFNLTLATVQLTKCVTYLNCELKPTMLEGI